MQHIITNKIFSKFSKSRNVNNRRPLELVHASVQYGDKGLLEELRPKPGNSLNLLIITTCSMGEKSDLARKDGNLRVAKKYGSDCRCMTSGNILFEFPWLLKML